MRFHGVLLGNQREIWSKQHNGKVSRLLFLIGGLQASVDPVSLDVFERTGLIPYIVAASLFPAPIKS
jgi:hypothetical protein